MVSSEQTSIRKAPATADRTPISERWNSEEQLVAWRAAWANVSNRYLECAGFAECIDHRSNTECGLDTVPTIHEDPIARALERQGIVSLRCEINRQIREQKTGWSALSVRKFRS